jgi:L-2-hydroxyglutarate oxidase LhgO
VESVDALVVGAGVVGLAVARALAQRGREVVVVEAEAGIGRGVSARSSEVVHGGLYYPSGSLKARLCVRGRQLLYAYCAARGVAHRRCGKLVVATDEAQLGALRALQAQALANGVDDLVWLDGAAARALEPELHACAALHSPSSGIVDSHALMLALQADAQAAGAQLAFGSRVRGGRVVAGGIEVEVDAGEAAALRLRARSLVNSAGLGAPALAARIAGVPAATLPRAHRCKGSYFALTGRAPFARLIYPLHDAAGLGVHLTLDLGGQARFGPDTEWLADDAPEDLRVDPARAAAFEAAVRRYWPGLPAAALVPAYAGVRPKIAGPGEPAADFLIAGPAEHGVPGLVQLLGIESPGLTACLAIAETVLARLDGAPVAPLPATAAR